MQAKLIGYSWKPDKVVCPRLIFAIEHLSPATFRKNMFCPPYWVLDYTFNYYGYYRIKGKHGRWQERLPHIAHLYPPHMQYWEDQRRLKSNLAHSAYINFTGGEKAGLAKMINRRFGYARFSDPAGILGDILQKIAVTGQKSGNAGYWQAHTRLCEIISLLLNARHIEAENYRIEPVDILSDKLNLAEKVGQYLRANVNRRIYLADIARHVSTSVSSLSHRYHEENGKTPIQELTDIRINLAKGFLIKGYTLKSIAEQLGFSDSFHLSKTFKRLEGISPRKFISTLYK